MRKVVILTVTLFTLGSTFAVAAPTQRNKITHTRIVQASKDTTLTYNGVKVFVPAGQAIILGQNSDGSIVVRGQNLNGVKIGEGTISAQGPVVLSVQPQTNVITVNRGADVEVTDGNGRTAALSQGASVSGKDIRVATVPTVAALATSTTNKAEAAKAPAAQTTATNKTTAAATTSKDTEVVETELPEFVSNAVIESAATEQAAQNVEETLSPSAPR